MGSRNTKAERSSAWYPRWPKMQFGVPCAERSLTVNGTHPPTPALPTTPRWAYWDTAGAPRARGGRHAKQIVGSPGFFPSTSISTSSIMHALSLDGRAALRIHGPAVSARLPLPQTVLASGPRISSAANQSVEEREKSLWKEDLGRENELYWEKEYGPKTVKALCVEHRRKCWYLLAGDAPFQCC